MIKNSSLQHFLESIMDINVTYMGGASAGILGSTSSRDDLVHALKKKAIAFARTYRDGVGGDVAIEKTAEEIVATLQALQLTNTVSMEKMTSLIDELGALVAQATGTK